MGGFEPLPRKRVIEISTWTACAARRIAPVGLPMLCDVTLRRSVQNERTSFWSGLFSC